jgi:hypothetical protein
LRDDFMHYGAAMRVVVLALLLLGVDLRIVHAGGA